MHRGGRATPSGLPGVHYPAQRFEQPTTQAFTRVVFRVRGGADATAIAGLSTGGAKAFLIGLNHLERFSHIGMFSAGWLPADLMKVEEEEQHRLLDDPSLPKRLKLLWLGVGIEDSLLAMLRHHGIKHTYRETDGDHTWINWRRYLNEFVPLLFR